MADGRSRDKSKKRRRESGFLEDSSLSMPSPSQNIIAGVNAGQDIPTQAIQMPSTSSLDETDSFSDDLSRHEIRDSLAHGGMSHLELQNKLATDVFMTDEDRHTYMEGLSKPVQTTLEPNTSLTKKSPNFYELPPTSSSSHQSTESVLFDPPKPSPSMKGPNFFAPPPASSLKPQASGGSLFDKHGPSPLEEIIVKLGQAIASMFGFSSEKGSKSSLPKHLRH